MSHPVPPSSESPDLFDYALVRDYARYVLGSARRHRALVAWVLVLVMLCAVAALLGLPRSYRTEVRILAQRNQVMASLGNPRRTVPGDADAPTRAARETVLRRDNLVALVKQTNLMDHWDANRAPLLRAKDWLVTRLKGPPAEEDRMDALVGLLEQRMWVNTGEGTVTIGLEWPHAQMAHRLVETAQQNFLEARHATEVSTIAEAISILEGHAASVHDGMAAALAELERANARTGQRGTTAPALARPRPSPGQRAAEQEEAQLETMISAKRRAISDLEEFRRRRLSELQVQLAELKTTYASAHPAVINAEEGIAALMQDSPQITALRREELELEAELKRRREQRGGRAEPGTDTGLLVVQEASTAAMGTPVEYAEARLRIATAKYEELLGRIDAARIELDTARAAFKYRYSIIKPAQVPKEPVSPNPAVVLVGGALCGLALAVFAAVLADLRARRIVEPWQVERQLGVPVLSLVRFR